MIHPHSSARALLVVAAILVGVALAQPNAASAMPSGGEIAVPGSGVVWAAPDQVQIDLGWSGIERDVATVIRAGEVAMAAIQSALIEAGVAPEDIRTIGYYLWREERWEDGGAPTLFGFRLTHNVSVLVRDVAIFARIMEVASAAGVNQIGGITFRVAEREALEREARSRAFADAERRAHELAALAGVRITGVRRIEEGGPSANLGLTTSADAYAEGRGGGFAPGQTAIEVRLGVVFDTER